MQHVRVNFAICSAFFTALFILVIQKCYSNNTFAIHRVADGCYQVVRANFPPDTITRTYSDYDATPATTANTPVLYTSSPSFQPAALKGDNEWVIDVEGSVAIDLETNIPLCDIATAFCCYRVFNNKVTAIYYGKGVIDEN